MADAIIEHVNLTVTDPERTAAIMSALFGWRIRWQGPAMSGGHTIHVGNDTAYLALYTNDDERRRTERHAKGEPLNHVGVLVDDLDAVEGKALALGLVPFSHGDYEPGRRFYLLDPDGIEYEIVSYA